MCVKISGLLIGLLWMANVIDAQDVLVTNNLSGKQFKFDPTAVGIITCNRAFVVDSIIDLGRD